MNRYVLLGVSLDCKMNKQNDTANICRSTYMSVQKINNIRRYLFKNSTQTLVNPTVSS